MLDDGIAQEAASKLFYEMSLDADPAVRRVGLLLRGAAAKQWPAAAIVPPSTRVTITAQCGDAQALLVSSDLDVPLEFQAVAGLERRTLSLGGPTGAELASGREWERTPGRKGGAVPLRLPLGDVVVSRYGQEFARLTAAERQRQRETCAGRRG